MTTTILISTEGERLEVQREVAELSEVFKTKLSESSSLEINVNSTSDLLRQMIDYMGVIHKHPDPESEERVALNEYFSILKQDILFDLIAKCWELKNHILTDVLCKIIVNMIKGKTPEEISVSFGIPNDFTP